MLPKLYILDEVDINKIQTLKLLIDNVLIMNNVFLNICTETEGHDSGGVGRLVGHWVDQRKKVSLYTLGCTSRVDMWIIDIKWQLSFG
jgi:hypothetical protein